MALGESDSPGGDRREPLENQATQGHSPMSRVTGSPDHTSTYSPIRVWAAKDAIILQSTA